MAMLISEYEHYISEDRDFDTPTSNGGRIGAIVDDDSMNVIMPEVTASEREAGLIRRSKVFMKNASVDRKMLNNIFFMKQDLLPPDRIRLIEASQNDSLTFEVGETLDGSTTTVTAGTAISISSVTGVPIVDLPGRKIIILGHELTIDTSDDTLDTIALLEDIDFDVPINTSVLSVDDFDFHESDEDFSTKKKYINSVVTEGVTNGASQIVISKVDQAFFDGGDTVVIVDGYFRVLYRGSIDTVSDHASNINAAVVSLSTAYSGVSIPALEAYLCNGVTETLIPGQTKSFWLELEIESESAIDSEVINQFQTGASFDDVAAV